MDKGGNRETGQEVIVEIQMEDGRQGLELSYGRSDGLLDLL